MPERSRRIIEAAIRLANDGGFQAVRLRDVASESGVALGTLYTRFRSKEDILVAALEGEAKKLEDLLNKHGVQGDTPLERVVFFFRTASATLFDRPNFARAVLRSLASAEPDIAEKVLNFHQNITTMITAAFRNTTTTDESAEASEAETKLGFMLQQMWFALLVGWMGGMLDEDSVITQLEDAANLLFLGMKATGEL